MIISQVERELSDLSVDAQWAMWRAGWVRNTVDGRAQMTRWGLEPGPGWSGVI